MTSALVIGMLLAIIVGLKTESIVLAVITWIVAAAAVYFILKILRGGMEKGMDAASDALSKVMEKKEGDKK